MSADGAGTSLSSRGPTGGGQQGAPKPNGINLRFADIFMNKSRNARPATVGTLGDEHFVERHTGIAFNTY